MAGSAITKLAGMMRSCVVSAIGCQLLLCLLCVTGKGYRNGYGPPERNASALSYNYSPGPLLSYEQLPSAWDWCNADGLDLCVSSWNQHEPVYCGACWLHATLSMVQDRLKIKKAGRGPDVMLSRQTMLNCGAYHKMGGGCDGGDPIDVFHYMHQYGLPDESCLSYTATDHRLYDPALPACPLGARCRNCMPLNDSDPGTCWAVKTPILYGLTSYGHLNASKGEQVQAMMTEIFNNGPITCSVAAPDDFTYGYRGGIWHDATSTPADIDHDVEIVGWGERDGKKFWKIRNSWGTFWGKRGFFELERGVNALYIEAGDCWVGTPEFSMEARVQAGDLVGSMYGIEEPPSQGILHLG